MVESLKRPVKKINRPFERWKAIHHAKEFQPVEKPRYEQILDLHEEILAIHESKPLREKILGTAAARGLHDKEKQGLKKIQLAMDIAEGAHKGQFRDLSNDPYIVHPYRSALLAMEISRARGTPLTSELIVGAILHDAVEDNPDMTKDLIYNQFRRFGKEYAELVSGDAEALSKYTKGKKLSPEAYVEKIINAPSITLARRLIIKTSDRIDNLLDPLRGPARFNPEDGLEDLRTRIINKTNEKFIPMLLKNPKLTVTTEDLISDINVVVDIANKSLTDENFGQKHLKEYLTLAA